MIKSQRNKKPGAWASCITAVVLEVLHLAAAGQLLAQTPIGFQYFYDDLGQVTKVVDLTEYFSEWYFGLYATDTWKATPRLTLNYGLRWEPYFPQVIRNGAIYQFDEARYAAGAKGTVFAKAPAGMSYPGDPGFAGKTGMPRKWWDLMPRLDWPGIRTEMAACPFALHMGSPMTCLPASSTPPEEFFDCV